MTCMTFTHHDIQDRLIGYLYGELGADDRAAFEGHLASCATCEAEVSALRATRSASRQAVRASLDEPVPAGVHGRVMEAVRRAARSRAVTGEVLGPPAKPHRFAWLRARWTLPMFATVAAMGALLLTRETIFREARHPLEETPAPAPSENAPERPKVKLPPGAPGAPVTGLGSADQQPARSRSQNRQDKATVRPKVGTGAGTSAATATPARKAEIASKKRAVPILDDLLSATESARPPARAAEPSLPEADQASTRSLKRVSDSVLDSDDAASLSGAVAPAVAGGPRAGAAAPSSARARAAAAPPAPAKSSNEGGVTDPTTELAGHADNALRSGNWPQAITLYGDLLRRFPAHPSAAAWRRHLATAQAAASRPVDPRLADPRLADPRSTDPRFAAPPPAR